MNLVLLACFIPLVIVFLVMIFVVCSVDFPASVVVVDFVIFSVS